MAGLREHLLKHCLCDCEVCNQRSECAVVPRYEGGVMAICPACLDQVRGWLYCMGKQRAAPGQVTTQ